MAFFISVCIISIEVRKFTMRKQKSHTLESTPVSPVLRGIRRVVLTCFFVLALGCALVVTTNAAAVLYSLSHIYTLDTIQNLQNDSLINDNVLLNTTSHSDNTLRNNTSPSNKVLQHDTPSHTSSPAPSPTETHKKQSNAMSSTQTATLSSSRVILVLGASVNPNKTPSPILRDRLNSAVAMYHAQGDATIIVSGDGREAHYNEPAVMKQYLVEHGIPEQRIVTDERGYTTYASMYHLAYSYHVKQCIIVSQKFHLARAISTGALLGVQCVGLSADTGTYEKAQLYELREIPARTKDILQALLRVKK